MMLLAAVAAEEGRIETRVLVIGMIALAIERDAPLPGAAQRGVDMPSAGDKAMQLEGQKRPVADAAALFRRPAHQHQHGLQLRAAARLVAAGLLREALRGLSQRIAVVAAIAAGRRESPISISNQTASG